MDTLSTPDYQDRNIRNFQDPRPYVCPLPVFLVVESNNPIERLEDILSGIAAGKPNLSTVILYIQLALGEV